MTAGGVVMKRWGAVVVLGACLVACGPLRGHLIAMPDGQNWYRDACRLRSECTQRALEQCPRGYYEYRGESEGRENATLDRELVYRCKTKEQASFSE